ncbi:hypothetical protein niasHT_027857 [Heterodera trifolii]|uniref:Uncharacterized protein n=1 Tax=Heterodera trifolii TaxID=157864 RepID=A0ABD2JKE1_9BILA
MLFHSVHRPLHSSPVPFARCHRYLSRPYVYPLFFMLVLFLLVRWNAVPDPGTTGARFSSDDEIAFEDTKLQVEEGNDGDTNDIVDAEEDEAQTVKATEEGPKRVIQKPPFLEESALGQKTKLRKKGNMVSLIVYMEALCPDTTGFVRRQLLPAWARLGATNRINVTIVPFGKAQCARTEAEEGEDYRCECQHGQTECELNQLMNCAIDLLPDADSFVPLVGCVQGKESVSAAFKSCLAGHSSSDRLWKCAMGREGRHLHALAGNRTAAIGDAFNFVPWVVLDGRRDNDAFYALEENLCKRFNEPQPIQCIKFS